MDNETPVLTGKIFEDDAEITVVELCQVCAVERRLVDDMIAEGILDPRGSSSDRLPYNSVRITRTVLRLQRDLGVNLAGAALALDLLDQIEQLRSQLRRY